MTIWILALVLLGLTVSLGYTQGAIRVAVGLIGLLVAAAVAGPASPMINWLLPYIRLGGPMQIKLIGPILTFIIISALFKVLGQFIHRKVEYHYKYHRGDARRAVWDRINRRLGACLAIGNAMVYLVLITLLVSIVGYTTLQVGASESGDWKLRMVNRLAADAQSTRMDRVVAPFNPSSERYMETADILGLLYHNRKLQTRVELYPPFMAIADRPELKALGADAEVQQLFQTEQNISLILANPKIAGVASNDTFRADIAALDLKDLRQYLETGKSPKYSQEPILGRWTFDLNATLRLALATRPELLASEWYRLKTDLEERYKRSIFEALTDNRAKVELPASIENTMPPSATNSPARLSSTGKWLKDAAGNYTVSLANKNGKADGKVTIVANRIQVPVIVPGENEYAVFRRNDD